jgi:hypothetical protein
MCNIKNTSNKYDVASGVGEITIEAEVLDGKDVKLVPFIVSVNGANMRLPDFTNLAALLKERTWAEVTKILNVLLHLAHEGKIKLSQTDFPAGPIIISYKGEAN